MLQVNNRSPYRKYFAIAGSVLLVLALGVGAYMMYRYVTSDPMGETTYKRSTPSVRTYEPTPPPTNTPKVKKTASPSPKPTHTPILNKSPSRATKSPTPSPTPSTTPPPSTPVVVTPVQEPITTP